MARARFDSISKRRLSPWALRFRWVRVAALDALLVSAVFLSDFSKWLYQLLRSGFTRLCYQLGRLSLQVLKIAVLVVLVALLRPTPPEPAGPRLGDASQTVIDFHRAIDGGAYHAAYSQLTPAWQRELGYQEFESGFRKARRLKVESIEAVPAGTRKAYVHVSVKVDQTLLQGHYRVHHDGYKWQLDGGLLRPRDDVRLAKL